MDFLSSLFEVWLEFFERQSDYTGGTDWFMTIVGWTVGILVMLIVMAVVATPLFFSGRYAYHTIMWYARRQRCQHAECGHEWTDEFGDGTDPGCLGGRPCCDSCNDGHIDAAVQRRADQEPRHDCVHGHGPMAKVVVQVLNGQMVMDRCDTCRGVWFDGGELAQLEERAEAAGYSRGRDDGASANLAVGIAIGTAI